MNELSVYRCNLVLKTDKDTAEEAFAEFQALLKSVGIEWNPWLSKVDNIHLEDQYGWPIPRPENVVITPRDCMAPFPNRKLSVKIPFESLFRGVDLKTVEYDEFEKMVHSGSTRAIIKSFVKEHEGFNPRNFSVTIQ